MLPMGLRSHLAPSPRTTVYAIRVRHAGSHGPSPLTRRTNLMRLTHMCFLLSNSVRWASLAEAAYCTWQADGVGCRGASGFCPFAGLAYFVSTAHVNLRLGLIICRSRGSETSRAASSALGIRGRIACYLSPFPRAANLMGCAHQYKTKSNRIYGWTRQPMFDKNKKNLLATPKRNKQHDSYNNQTPNPPSKTSKNSPVHAIAPP